jgi:hypothetical protein
VPNMRKMRIIQNLPYTILEERDHFEHMGVEFYILLTVHHAVILGK